MNRHTVCGVAALMAVAACSSDNNGTGVDAGGSSSSTSSTSTSGKGSTSSSTASTTSVGSTTTNTQSSATDTSSTSTTTTQDAGIDATTSDAGETGSDASNDATIADGSTASDADMSDADMSDAGDGAAAATCPTGITGGCAALAVPLSDSNQSTHFVVQLPSPGDDFTGATITAQVAAPGGGAGALQAFVQHGPSFPDGGSAGYSEEFLGWKAVDAMTSWTTVTWAVTNATFDPTGVQYLGLSIESGGATDASTFEQPATTVYVASITVTVADAGAPTYSIVFDAASKISSGFSWNKMSLNTNDALVTGSTLTWLPAAP